MNAGADVLVIDTSHGHSMNVINAVKKIKHSFPDSQVIAGNVATVRSVPRLLLMPDQMPVKIGICTRLHMYYQNSCRSCVQFAIQRKEISDETGVPIIADGGIKFGDIAKAIKRRAHSVMLEALLPDPRRAL